MCIIGYGLYVIFNFEPIVENNSSVLKIKTKVVDFLLLNGNSAICICDTKMDSTEKGDLPNIFERRYLILCYLYCNVFIQLSMCCT